MNKKWLLYLVIVILAVILFVVKRCGNDKPNPKTIILKKNTGTGINRNRGFDRRVSYIEYTEHAKCRMDCRKISQSEVEEIMKDGKINYTKSDLNAQPCPVYALEGITHDDQRVRIVFAQCDYKSKVVTCIDLNTEWECHCPGDDDKYKNKN
ncbi:MAG: DUF4258 domain-containing protein [Bacteroidia bacterium]|nr:DUF4258 domain-containing protein [Bacteroidia bacterium]